ncbi:MAG: metallophosphoesterase [Chitinophagaceae bacterium]|nr:metallophosphoesterase [Chitinophagaceae bacterium]
MRNSPFWWILIGLMLLLDIYFFQALRLLTQHAGPRTRAVIFIFYWLISVSAIVILLILPYLKADKQALLGKSTIFSLIMGLFIAKLVASIFFFLDDLRRGVQWSASRIMGNSPANTADEAGEKISRSVFMSWAGLIAGGGLFGTLVYGFGNKYRYQVRRQKLSFPQLPTAFKGLKIAHISDIHSGSFTDKEAVAKGVMKIMQESPDLILFTGDLVNNVATEMDDYMDVFDKLQAPLGVYSTLGNHDYGDYVQWDSPEDKKANLDQLKNVHARLGWKLLMNEHVKLEKAGQQIAILGVENWSSKGRFPKHGNLPKAYLGAADQPFKILLSHDPSHWQAEVLESYPDIDLVLSGHTHGMQFGVEIPGLKWSPVQYLYKEWAGLYEHENGQKLYVNRGFGFLGYTGRVGILPEITILELV